MELFPYRLDRVSNFVGVFAHELTHLITKEFYQEWQEKYKWDYCTDHPNRWKRQLLLHAPNTDPFKYQFINKATGEISPTGQFPLLPDECVTYYAKLNLEEDICETMVAYLFAPDILDKVSPGKKELLAKHDRQKNEPVVTARRVENDKIKLPEIKPQIVKYYVDEPQAKLIDDNIDEITILD